MGSLFFFEQAVDTSWGDGEGEALHSHNYRSHWRGQLVQADLKFSLMVDLSWEKTAPHSHRN